MQSESGAFVQGDTSEVSIIVYKGMEYKISLCSPSHPQLNGSFQFNHVRYHRNYDALICLGISPDDLFFDMWTASDVKTGKAGSLVTMEKGANASFKLTKKKAKLLSINKFINKVDEIIMSL